MRRKGGAVKMRRQERLAKVLEGAVAMVGHAAQGTLASVADRGAYMGTTRSPGDTGAPAESRSHTIAEAQDAAHHFVAHAFALEQRMAPFSLKM